VKKIKKEAAALIKRNETNAIVFNGLLELIDKGKIAKPEKLFYDATPKLDVNNQQKFTYLNLGKKKYFFLDFICPFGSEITNQLSAIKKELPKSKVKNELEAQKAFLEGISEIVKGAKGYASGFVKYVRTEQKDEIEVCFLEVKKGVTVGKSTTKKTLADEVNNIEYLLQAKNEQVLELLPLEEEKANAKTDEANADSEGEPKGAIDPALVKKQVQEFLAEYKALEANKAFKKLKLIHNITKLINQLENIPENLETLINGLNAQQQKIKSIFSKQIDQKLDASMKELEELALVNSSSELDAIFNVIQKMYQGWKVFLPEDEHPQGAAIDKVSEEIDLLKYYEEQIVPLRKQHEKATNHEEKEQLTNQINTLINEAREALV